MPAQAAFILGGNTHPEFPGTNPSDGIGNVNGYINFAVYGQGGGVAGDTYGTGVANADAILAAAGFFNGGVPQAAPPAVLPGFVYFFQVLNAATNDVGGGPAPPISSATIVTAGTIAGFGTLASTATQPLPGIPIGTGVGAAYLGVDLKGGNLPPNPVTGVWTFGPPAPAGNQSPAVVVLGGATASLGVIATNGATSQLTPTSLQENFAPFGSIAASGRSYVFGYTTNLPPNSFTTGSIQDHGTSAVGTVPLPTPVTGVPEPSTILMVATALPLALVYLRRRKRGTLAA